jgi:NADPH:quinone reductase-like Zn-dependent oxidoreductase
MKAVLHTRYGPPDELQLREVEKPVPGDNEVLIRVHTSSVTSTDCNARNLTFVTKVFFIPARLMFGVFRPKETILGFDMAGEVEAVGKDVKRFKPGDEVFGAGGLAAGAHAEYISLAEYGTLTTKPARLSWEEAGAVFLGASTALYFIRDLGNVQPGQQVLIYGASGGIGTYAVQLAKHFGAEVTGVCSGANLAMVEGLGADRVIDYTKEDFTSSGEAYDLIFDAAGKTSFSRCKGSLKEKGIFLPVIMGLREIVQLIWTPMTGGKKVKSGVANERLEDLEFFRALIEAGELKPVIDRCYRLERAAEAFRYVEKGHKKGNVGIIVARDP